MLLLLFICALSGTALAAPQAADMSAYSFYTRYGSGEIVFCDGFFYYCSRGSAGAVTRTRYAVSGQKFTLQIAGKQYETGVSVKTEEHDGSCRRIRYEYKDGYYYSLYEISYDCIYEGLSKRYPEVDFNRQMYNRDVRLQIDFYLTLIMNQEAKGQIREREDGTIQKIGSIYETLDEILQAADWSARTQEALKGYYGLSMTIRQPSSYIICYHKGIDKPECSTLRQKIQYGESTALRKNSFKKAYAIGIYPYGEETQDRYSVEETFLGWADAEGEMKYRDEQRVKNLTDIHQKVIHLYAVWEEACFTFPEAAERRGEVFLGYSTQGESILVTKSQAENLELHSPGGRILVNRNLTFYGIWCRKYQKVRFVEPDASAEAAVSKVISGEQMNRIRDFMYSCMYAGEKRLRQLREAFL